MRIRHLLKIFGLFFSMLLVLSIVVYGIQSLFLKEDMPFFKGVFSGALYIMGYGDSVTASRAFQSILAVIGLFGLNIFAACITVNLFWRIKDVALSDAAKVTFDNGKYYLTLIVINKGVDIVHFQASLLFHKPKSNAHDVYSKAWSYPIIKKGEPFVMNIPLDEDEKLRDRLRSMLFFQPDMKMVATFSYADSRTGYESVRVMSYNRDKITVVQHSEKFYEWLIGNAYPLDLSLIRPINEGTIKLNHCESGGLQAMIDFKVLNDRCEHPDFVMAAFINRRQAWEWCYKFRRNAFLNITMNGTANIKALLFEVKTVDDQVYQREVPVSVDMDTKAIKLSDLFQTEDQCIGIREVCFTVKKEYINPPDTEATLFIKRIEMVLPGQPEDDVETD